GLLYTVSGAGHRCGFLKVENTPIVPDPARRPHTGRLPKSFKGNAKGLDVTSLVVYRNPGCVFLLIDGRDVYCSPAGANNFKRVSETWKEVRAHAEKTRDPKHLFALAETSIKESRDGGATWRKPISLPKGFVVTSST